MSDYFETLQIAIPSKKLHRAGLNHFFDFQVQRHAAVLNPVSSVRNERYQVNEGKTPEAKMVAQFWLRPGNVYSATNVLALTLALERKTPSSRLER